MKKSKDILAEDALIKEVSDEVKNDKLKSLWDQYGLYIIIFVALALTAAVSFETFRNWINKRNQEISNAFAVAVSLQNQNRIDESLKILENLAEHSGVYGDIAKLQIANIYFEQGRATEAAEILQVLADGNGDNPQMQEIAALKLAAYKIDTNADAAEIKELLQPLTKTDDGEGYNVATELLAMLAIRDGDLPEAKAAYERIIASGKSSETLKARAQDMVNIIDGQTE